MRLKSQLRTLLAEVVKCLQCKDLQPGQKQEASKVPIKGPKYFPLKYLEKFSIGSLSCCYFQLSARICTWRKQDASKVLRQGPSTLVCKPSTMFSRLFIGLLTLSVFGTIFDLAG